MNSTVIGAFLSGLVVGGILVAFLISRWVTTLMRKRWMRLLEESPQFYEGAYSAWSSCLDLAAKADTHDSLLRDITQHAKSEKDRVQKLLEYKEERADSLGQQDAIREFTGEGK